MSNSNNPASNVDAARNQANSDSNNGNKPANTQTWDWASRQTYDNQWQWNQNKKNE